MPIRVRSSRLAKLPGVSNDSTSASASATSSDSTSNAGRRGVSRNSSFHSVSQEQLERLAQHAADVRALEALQDEDDDVDAEGEDVDDKASLGIILNSDTKLSSNGGGLVQNGHNGHNGHNGLSAIPRTSFIMPPNAMSSQQEAPTAEDVALEIYGDSIKIDSALCRKLASEPAVHDPSQRRPGQRLNMERRSNVEAVLAHITGEFAPSPCKNCRKGHGPWTTCIVYEGQMCGSCTNCWYNASGARCTFHENNHPQPHIIYGAVASGTAPGTVIYQQTPVPLPHQPQAVGNLSQVSQSGLPRTFPDMSNWGLSDPTGRLVTQAMGDVVGFSRRERHLARIEAAAKELGMRIAEYEEYLRTAEGMAEHQRAQEQAQEQAQARLSDGGVDDSSSHASPLR
ncbi:hypothetical protein EDB81DRAFT_760337 [Dactylonectria macrodidyma]|uniref:Uncharacterized protein n=1 Tax=Dactylonectria macrodidyma TaxID=307937 RepID=A0A9P9ES51_9HYPO|nr:hypothetical protein EDB81DRAFT_760337 [Dactylonectria macrodidyma]